MQYFDDIDDVEKERIFKKAARKAYAEVVKTQMLDILDLSIKNETSDERLLRLVQEKNAIKKNHKPKVYLDPYHVVGTTKYKYPGVTQAEVKLLHSRVKKTFELSWINSCDWSYELTGDGYIHFHAWLVPSQPIAPADVKDRLKRSQLKYLIDFKKSSKFLQIYRRSREIDKKNTMSYITKNEKKDCDFRKLFSLEDIYKCHTGEGIPNVNGVSPDCLDVESEQEVDSPTLAE